MTQREIAAALERMQSVLTRRPSAGLQADEPCQARWIEGMRVAARDRAGREVVTDVPAALGGDGSAVSPGWLIRAGLANCMASCIVLASAKAGVALERLEVDVASRSDARALFGMTDETGAPVFPGLRDLQMTVRIGARGAAPDELRGLVDAARTISPVQAAIEQAAPVAVRVEVG